MTPNLAQLIRSQELEALEDAWLEALEDPGDHQIYCEAVESLCGLDMTSRALSLATPMVDALAEQGRTDAAVELAHTVVRLGAHNEGLARRLFDLLEGKFGAEEWFPLLRDRANLTAESLTTKTLAEFDRLCQFTVGNVIYHPAGWGEGLVEAFRSGQEEVVVRFASGRTESFPLNTVLDKFRPLDSGDLRAMRLTAMEELERLVKEDLSALIQKTARLYRGRVTSTQVKDELCPSIVPAKKWATFWRKAKAAAAHDPWLQVEGSTARPVFVLRTKPLSLADEAKKALEHTNTLGERLAVIRPFLERCHEAETKETLIEMARQAVEDALAEGKAAHADILDGILLLERQGLQASIPAVQEVRILVLGEAGEFSPEAIDTLPTQESKDHTISLLAEALGETWIDTCISSLTRFPSSVVEQLVDLMVEAGHGARTLEIWASVAPYPRRHPMLTYLLGRLYADGVFEGQPGLPDQPTVGRVLLHLGRVLAGERRGSTTLARLLTRLTSLLTGRRELLAKIIESVDKETLASYLGITERGGADFPQEISDVVLRAVANRYPELTEKRQKPFWELDYVFVTSRGLQRQRAEYRQLVDEKIPENSAAIGRAASHGDLSENSEWEVAMEEQRNLTHRASLMDTDLRNAKLIEDQVIPEDLVAPGVKVLLTVLDSGETRSFTILGPWDADGDEIINYRAPLAQSLLGKSLGEEATLTTPSGEERVRIDELHRVV